MDFVLIEVPAQDRASHSGAQQAQTSRTCCAKARSDSRAAGSRPSFCKRRPFSTEQRQEVEQQESQPQAARSERVHVAHETPHVELDAVEELGRARSRWRRADREDHARAGRGARSRSSDKDPRATSRRRDAAPAGAGRVAESASGAWVRLLRVEQRTRRRRSSSWWFSSGFSALGGAGRRSVGSARRGALGGARGRLRVRTRRRAGRSRLARP